MTLQELFTKRVETPSIECWDDKSTASALRTLAVRLHSTGVSLRETAAALEQAGITREQVVSIDREKVDEALDVVSLPESAVYNTEESEYVRKAEVDEERKETRLQGLKDRLAVSDDPEADVLRQEVERLEGEIEDLTEFSPTSTFKSQAESG